MIPARVPARQWRAALLLAFLVPVCWGPTARAQAVQAIGEVSAVVGRATVTRFQEAAQQPLSVGTELFEGDRLVTARDARLRVTLQDGSTLQLGAGTSLTLEWVLHAPALDQQNVLLTMTTGILRTIVETLLPVAVFRVETATAVTSVRGTDWIIEAAPQTAAIVALEGRVAVENAAESVPGVVVLGPGEGTSVDAGEPPAPPSIWGDARRNDFIARTTVP